MTSSYCISLYIALKARVDLLHPDLLQLSDEVKQMPEGGIRDRSSLSDTELLNALELLLRHPEFYDLSLSFDSEEGKFYAGWEVGTDLRDVLRTVLMRNRPAGLPLHALLPSLIPRGKDSPNSNHELDLRHESGTSSTSAANILLHPTES